MYFCPSTSKRGDPDDMQHSAVFHMGLHCSQKYRFRGFHSTRNSTDALTVVRPTGVHLLGFFCSGIQFYVPLSPCLCFISILYLDLYVLGDDTLIS